MVPIQALHPARAEPIAATTAAITAAPTAAAPAPQSLSLQQALEIGLKGSLSLRGSTLSVQEG